nr:hypothetical protein [Tanacetum cinerariifolium]
MSEYVCVKCSQKIIPHGVSEYDEFVCPASFQWHAAKNVVRDPFPTTSDFNAEDYVTLVAHPSTFWKFLEPFLCLVGLSRHYTLDEDTYSRVVERERAEGEPRVLETTIGRTIPLLLIALDRADSDLEASVNQLFDEGGSGAGGEQEARTAAGVRIVSGEDVAVEDPRHLRKKGKLQRMLVVATMLPFVTSSISATPEHHSGVLTAPERFLISSDSSQHSANASEAEGSSIIRSVVILLVVTEAVITTQVASIPSTADPEPSTNVVTPVHTSMFQDSGSARTVRPDVASSSHAIGEELSLGSREVNSESLHEVFVPQWNILNDSLLDSLDVSREFFDHLAPLVSFSQIWDMDYEELFTEISVGTTRQACLSAELRMRTEFCLSERMRLESQLGKQANLLKSKDEEVEDLKARLLLKEAEAAEAIHLRSNAILKKERDALDGKVTDLAASVTGKERELTTLQLTVIKTQNNNLVDQEVLNPFKKTCVWKKAVGFLGSLPVPIQHTEWKPDYEGNFSKKEEGDGQWHAEIRLTGPYRNAYD